MIVSTFHKYLQIRQWVEALAANFECIFHPVINDCYVDTATGGMGICPELITTTTCRSNFILIRTDCRSNGFNAEFNAFCGDQLDQFCIMYTSTCVS